jgi:hypothetical protein
MGQRTELGQPVSSSRVAKKENVDGRGPSVRPLKAEGVWGTLDHWIRTRSNGSRPSSPARQGREREHAWESGGGRGAHQQRREVATRCPGGFGGSSRPPWTNGRSGKRQNRREQPVLWELGLLQLARWGERERKGSCLGR